MSPIPLKSLTIVSTYFNVKRLTFSTATILFLMFCPGADGKIVLKFSQISSNASEERTKFNKEIIFMTEASDEINQQYPSSPVIVDSITINSDVVIPEYNPLDVPYSEWEIYRSQELLDANGFGNTHDEWRRAAQHSSGLIRSKAFYLLTRNPKQEDKDLLRQGINDIDETVQALSAYGLYILGDQSTLSTIERIARLGTGAHSSAVQAAGILAQLEKPAAFSTIQEAFNSDLEYLRLFAVQNLIFFVPLNGQPFSSGKVINVWDAYESALKDKSPRVQGIARLQLKELGTVEAEELLQRIPELP